MNRKLPVLLSMVLSAGSATAARAQAPAPAQNPCGSAEHRQFDFWIGDWEVWRADTGKLAGHNRIERVHGGCVLQENYRAVSGYSGQSLNMYDAARRVWHQSWADSSGLLLIIEGGLRGDRMVMEGAGKDAQGADIRHRITWCPQQDGSVRQLWESTNAGGKWGVAFDGIYRRIKVPGK